MEYESGRELDALIAERVMGLQVDWEFDEPRALALCDQYDEMGWLPYYSSDIADAWLVIQHLMTGNTITAPIAKFGRWFDDAQLWALDAKEAALEICRAALRAIDKP